MGKIATTGYHNGCKITGAEIMPPKAAGKDPQVAVGFQNAAGDYITWYGSLSERALPYTIERLRNAGWKGNDLETIGTIVGGVVDIKVAEDSYNGTTSMKVSGIYAPKPREKADPGTVKSIAANYMGRIAALAKKEEPAAEDDGDLPF